MDGSKVKFGDKIFLYGQFMNQDHWDEREYGDPQYNTVMGYIPVGGYGITPKKTDIPNACLPGYVVEFLPAPSLAVAAAFSDEELVDVSDLLSLQAPLPDGCKVWMPVCDFL